MATTRTTFTLADPARHLGVDISAAAHDGVAAAVRSALARADRAASRDRPEQVDDSWSEAGMWGDA